MDQFKIKKIVLLVLICLPLLGMFLFGNKIEQNQAYHTFADVNSMFGVNNFHNVFSNIVFTIFSLIGLREYFKNKDNYTISWLVFLIGVFLVAPGSAYYHYGTSNETLVWDRLPMTIGFMGLTSLVMTEVFNIKKELPFLITLLCIGIYSVVHWAIFGDLRIYVWVQLTPILALLYVSLLIPTKSLKAKHLFLAVALYLLAKFCESKDKEIYNMISYSGHSIKHIVASLSVFTLILMNRKKVV